MAVRTVMRTGTLAKRSKSVTAAEFMQQLESDPEWVRNRDEREAKQQERARMLAENEAPLVADLNAAGFPVASVYDFVNSANTYEAALPILADHLVREYHERIHEGILRALSVPAAKQLVGDSLIAEFQNESDPNMRFVIANALSQMYLFSEVSHIGGISEHKALFRR